MRDASRNLPSLRGVFFDYAAPIVRNAASPRRRRWLGVEELVRHRTSPMAAIGKCAAVRLGRNWADSGTAALGDRNAESDVRFCVASGQLSTHGRHPVLVVLRVIVPRA